MRSSSPFIRSMVSLGTPIPFPWSRCSKAAFSSVS